MHCAASQKVRASIPDELIIIFKLTHLSAATEFGIYSASDGDEWQKTFVQVKRGGA
jgi:hypothetical protein